jgi:hypothetical protein
MEYESDRALNDSKLEEAKRKALSDFDTYLGLKGEVHDPNFAQPTYQSRIPTVLVDEAQGFWINGGKTGSKKDEQIEAPRGFDHDLPNLAKDGPTTLPKGEWAESKLTPAEIEERMKARTIPTDEDLAQLLNITVLGMYKGMEAGIYHREGLINLYKSGLRSE